MQRTLAFAASRWKQMSYSLPSVHNEEVKVAFFNSRSVLIVLCYPRRLSVIFWRCVVRGYFARSLVFSVALLLIASSSALADSVSFSLTSNNLMIPGSVGTVMITDSGMNQVTVTITMNAGFSLKLEGGDVAFNGPSGLTSGSATGIAGTAGMIGFAGLTFHQFHTDHELDGFGKFSFDYANLKGAPNGIVSADTLTFVLTAPGLMANQFTGAGIHFCTASGASCGPNTGFASSGPPASVPEPGTLSMMGAGLVGMATLVRRRVRG
jgi:PEP-CTERM motif-containing protein